MEKPHLKRENGYWTCRGQERIGFGITAAGAYGQWRVMLPGRVAMLAPKIPTRHDAALLEALKTWEPTQAH